MEQKITTGSTKDIVKRVTAVNCEISKMAINIDKELRNSNNKYLFVKNQQHKSTVYSEVLQQVHDHHIISARRALLCFLSEVNSEKQEQIPEYDPANADELDAKQLRKCREKLLERIKTGNPDLSESEIVFWDHKLKFLFKSSGYCVKNNDGKFVRTNFELENAIELAYVLKFNPYQLDKFCTRVFGDTPFYVTSSKGFIHQFCLTSKKYCSYRQAQEIIANFEKKRIIYQKPKANIINQKGQTEVLCNSAPIKSNKLDDLERFLKNNISLLDQPSITARSAYRKLAAYLASLMRNTHDMLHPTDKPTVEILTPDEIYDRVMTVYDAEDEQWNAGKIDDVYYHMVTGEDCTNQSVRIKYALEEDWFYLRATKKGKSSYAIQKVYVGERILKILQGTQKVEKYDLLILLFRIFKQHIDITEDVCGSQYADSFYALGRLIVEECFLGDFYAPAFLEFSLLMCLCGNVSLDAFVKTYAKKEPEVDVADEDAVEDKSTPDPPANDPAVVKKFRDNLGKRIKSEYTKTDIKIDEFNDIVKSLTNYFRDKYAKYQVIFLDDGIYECTQDSKGKTAGLSLYRYTHGDILNFSNLKNKPELSELINTAKRLVDEEMRKVHCTLDQSEIDSQVRLTSLKFIVEAICDGIKANVPERSLEFEKYLTKNKTITLSGWKP